jgi:hypothetical protein
MLIEDVVLLALDIMQTKRIFQQVLRMLTYLLVFSVLRISLVEVTPPDHDLPLALASPEE